AGRTVTLDVRLVPSLATRCTEPSSGIAPGASCTNTLLATPSVNPCTASSYACGSAPVNRGVPRASTVVGTVTTTARHSIVPRPVVTRTTSPHQSISSAGQFRTTSRPPAALATTVPSPSGTAQFTSVS